jgi:Ca2+-binding RTX toxin-like protein
LAKFVIGDAMGDYGQITDTLNTLSLSLLDYDRTFVRYEDVTGNGFEVGGTGFTLGFLRPTGGTVNSADLFNAGGDALVTVTGLNRSLPEMFQVYESSGLEAVYSDMASGNDTFIGSGNDDILRSGLGNDRLKGFGGSDILHGSKGRDVMTGGRGADAFVFAEGDGRDRITDFHDTNGAGDDVILISRKMYRNMTETETATGVTLDFGSKGTLVVDDWHLADIGRSDFEFL